MAGRHAKGRGRHAQPDTRPPLLMRAILWGFALTLIVTFFPVLLGLGLALGIMFGWASRAITRN